MQFFYSIRFYDALISDTLTCDLFLLTFNAYYLFYYISIISNEIILIIFMI